MSLSQSPLSPGRYQTILALGHLIICAVGRAVLHYALYWLQAPSNPTADGASRLDVVCHGCCETREQRLKTGLAPNEERNTGMCNNLLLTVTILYI